MEFLYILRLRYFSPYASSSLSRKGPLSLLDNFHKCLWLCSHHSCQAGMKYHAVQDKFSGFATVPSTVAMAAIDGQQQGNTCLLKMWCLAVLGLWLDLVSSALPQEGDTFANIQDMICLIYPHHRYALFHPHVDSPQLDFLLESSAFIVCAHNLQLKVELTAVEINTLVRDVEMERKKHIVSHEGIHWHMFCANSWCIFSFELGRPYIKCALPETMAHLPCFSSLSV